MVRQATESGWSEVTTKRYNVTGPYKAFQPAKFWVEMWKNRPQMKSKGRAHCQRCGAKWDEVPEDTMTFFVMTDRGNTVVCQQCFDLLKFPELTISEPTKQSEG